VFYLVTANVGKMMTYRSDKIDLKFQLGAAVSMFLLLYSSSFDVPRRFTSDAELRRNLISCLSHLFLTERFFPRPKEATSAFTDTRGSTRFPDVYIDIRKRSLLFAARTHFFGNKKHSEEKIFSKVIYF